MKFPISENGFSWKLWNLQTKNIKWKFLGRHWIKWKFVGSFPCSERFFSAYSSFPLSSKTSISKFQFDQKSGRRRTPLCGCATCESLFIYFILFNKLLLFKTLKRDKKNYLEQPHMIPFLKEFLKEKQLFHSREGKL